MGNRVGKFGHCFAGNGGEISRRHEINAILTGSVHKGLGHSFCYIRPDPPRPSTSSKVHSLSEPANSTTAFISSISGASVSANASTAPLTAAVECSATLDPAATFESSDSFASLPLQPVPRGASSSGSGGIPSSGQIERGFLSGPIERGFLSGPMERTGEDDDDEPRRSSSHTSSSDNSKASPDRKNLTFVRSFKRAISNKIKGLVPETETPNEPNHVVAAVNTNLSLSCDDGYNGDDDNDGELSSKSQSLQWAQGKAGEDRTHIVISEENGWVFIGIYDGFNGPDAPDHLTANLYNAVYEEIKGLWNGEVGLDEGIDSNPQSPVRKKSKKWKCERCREGDMMKVKKSKAAERHWDVLKALAKALKKTEEAYLEEADKRVKENPELALMGSCVLVMLMKGQDVYLMNVGDSRAVLAQKDNLFPTLSSLQLTLDHSTYVKQEVERIRKEHPDDDTAIVNDRVKGYLKVTRAFGAGFLKQPRWNDALLEMFQIDYVGTSPYLTCQPSLSHHKLCAKDRFLILSSDGLYQFFTSDEAVSEVEVFIALFPEGDPAQHLVEELLFRAAKKAGMDFHELLDIPQGERRRYHDDVSVIVISFEGRRWRSSV